MNIYISVIIATYNRKEFLLDAIKSAINQTLDKKYYEIIVIKNFEDDIIDNYITKNNIKGIISNNKLLAAKLFEALNVANGNIISFLDDYDLFTNNKLEIVYNKFKNNNKLCYYHNGYVPVNDKYEKLNSKGDKGIAVNMSSISIKKDILNLDNLKKITYNEDDFIYLSAPESNKKIIKGKEKLTYYMFHNSSSQLITTNLYEFKANRIKYENRNLEQFMSFKCMFSSSSALRYTNSRIALIKIVLYFFGVAYPMDNSIYYFANTILFAKYLLVRLHKKSRIIIVKKLWNEYRKQWNMQVQHSFLAQK